MPSNAMETVVCKAFIDNTFDSLVSEVAKSVSKGSAYPLSICVLQFHTSPPFLASLGLFLVRTSTWGDGSPRCIVQEGPMGPPRADSYNHEWMLNAYGPLAGIFFRTGTDVDAMLTK